VDGKFQVVFETLDQLLTVDSKPKKIGFLTICLAVICGNDTYMKL
jgi:hypothetical protein